MTAPDGSSVTPVEPPDLHALADLMAASRLLHRYGGTRAAALASLERGRAAGDLLLAGRSAEGTAVALAWVIPSRILTGAAYLKLLLVAEGDQDAGLGARLLAVAEARAREGANHLALLVTTDNLEARRFYERHGYRHVGDLPGFAAPGLDEALYVKTLRPHGQRLPV